MNLTKLRTKTILIIGSDGTIGSELMLSLKRNKLVAFGTTRRPIIHRSNKIFLDLSDKDSFDKVLNKKFDYVFICSGISNILKCENNPEETRLINVINTVEIAKKLGERGSHIIYLSSNRVFDPDIKIINNKEELNPKTEYGKQKADCELLLKTNKFPLTIVRLSEVINKKYRLFNYWVSELREGKYIYPFYDFNISPISSEFAINGFQKIICSGYLGTVHFSASYDVSYSKAILHVANSLKLNTSLIRPISCKDKLNSFGKKYATLSCDVERNLGIVPPDPFKSFDNFIKAQ